MTARVAIDLSRLLARAGYAAPTGIDRVEFAYARHFINRGDACIFLARTPLSGLGTLPADAVAAFIAALDTRWRGEPAGSTVRSILAAQKLLLSALIGSQRTVGKINAAAYLLVSHRHLDRPTPIARLKQRIGARFIPLVHDLIPLLFPEFVRPGHAERHRRRIETVARLADAIIINSEATRSDLEPFLTPKSPPVIVAPLGVEMLDFQTKPQTSGRPYFICVGTIEPRKNHLLLLSIWRRLAAKYGENAPRLVLVGRRGWENENIVDLLQRSPPIRQLVDERGAVGDKVMIELLAGARALLMPSFTEGYGLPVVEALNVGTPVICSDLAALRAVGGRVPDYLDPLNGPAWQTAIMDYASEESSRRRAQLDRLSTWRAPSWEAHFALVDELIERVVGST